MLGTRLDSAEITAQSKITGGEYSRTVDQVTSLERADSEYTGKDFECQNALSYWTFVKFLNPVELGIVIAHYSLLLYFHFCFSADFFIHLTILPS